MNHLKINECCILLEREEFPLIKRQGREEEEEGGGKKRKVQNFGQGDLGGPLRPSGHQDSYSSQYAYFHYEATKPLVAKPPYFNLSGLLIFTVVNPIRLILSICAQEKGILVGEYVQQRPMVPFPNPEKGGFVKRSVFMDSTSPIGGGGKADSVLI